MLDARLRAVVAFAIGEGSGTGVAVGVTKTKPYSVEKVISSAQFDTVKISSRPVINAAQTIVIVGSKIVVHVPFPVGIEVVRAVVSGDAVGESGMNATGGSSHSVNCGIYDVTIWLISVIASGDAPGDGVIYVSTSPTFGVAIAGTLTDGVEILGKDVGTTNEDRSTAGTFAIGTDAGISKDGKLVPGTETAGIADGTPMEDMSTPGIEIDGTADIAEGI